MTPDSDKTIFSKALAAYDEHMLRACGETSVEEYLKIKEEAIERAARVIAEYREAIAGDS